MREQPGWGSPMGNHQAGKGKGQSICPRAPIYCLHPKAIFLGPKKSGQWVYGGLGKEAALGDKPHVSAFPLFKISEGLWMQNHVMSNGSKDLKLLIY